MYTFPCTPPFSLSLSLLNSHISKLTSCNFSPLINTPISVMIFTHFSINLAMSIKKQPINIYQLRWLLKLKINKCTLYLCASQVKLLNDFCYSYTPIPTRFFWEMFYTSAHIYTMHQKKYQPSFSFHFLPHYMQNTINGGWEGNLCVPLVKSCVIHTCLCTYNTLQVK